MKSTEPQPPIFMRNYLDEYRTGYCVVEQMRIPPTQTPI